MIEQDLDPDISSTIKRLPGVLPHRSSGSSWGGLAFALASSRRKDVGMPDQARLALERLDVLLSELGAVRTGILHATVFLADLQHKSDFDEAWAAWIGSDPQGWPSRACVAVTLTPGTLCEISVIAARG